MKKITILNGLPGCGKSTYCKELNSSIVCPDDIRLVISGGDYANYEFTKENERITWGIAQMMVRSILRLGRDVVIDATGLNPIARKQWVDIGQEFNARIECVTFSTSVETCIERRTKDKKSDNNTTDWSELIRNMSRYFVAPTLSEGFDVIIYK